MNVIYSFTYIIVFNYTFSHQWQSGSWTLMVSQSFHDDLFANLCYMRKTLLPPLKHYFWFVHNNFIVFEISAVFQFIFLLYLYWCSLRRRSERGQRPLLLLWRKLNPKRWSIPFLRRDHATLASVRFCFHSFIIKYQYQ